MSGGEITGLTELVADLGRISGKAGSEVDAILKKGAQVLKEEYGAQASRSTHFRGMSGSFSYDSTTRLGEYSYEVGPDKDRKGGALGNIAFFGGANGGGGTLDLDKPFKSESEEIMKRLDAYLGGL